MSRLEISVLGSPKIEVDGVPLQVDTRKAIALLAYLATTGRTQSRERLAGLLWPDYDEDRARAALRRTLSTLRKALGDRWVSADRLNVSLDLNDLGFDLAVLRDALGLAAAHHPGDEEICSDCVAALTVAVDPAGGAFLQGFSLRDAEPFEEWQSLEAESVERELIRALDKLVRAHSAAGDLEAAVTVARRKLDRDPLDEPTHRQLMQLFAWRGMRGAALQQYRECVAVLDRELGVSPLPETTVLYDSIGEGAVEEREQARLQKPTPRRVAQTATGYPLRGRSVEWKELEGLYSGIEDSGVLVSIEGEAGIGKTRLAAEFLDTATERGAVTRSVRSSEGEGGLPYALITKLLEQFSERIPDRVSPGALVEVSRLVPALRPEGATPGSIDEPGAINRFFDGISESLVACMTGPAPGVVLLDDLHWCDTASLEVLTFVARGLDESPILLLAGWRTEEVDQDHPLRRLISSATGMTRSIHLERLGQDAVLELVRDASVRTGVDVEGLAGRLMAETEGIPFFIVEYLAVATDEGADWELPSSVTDLLRSRVGLVGETARQVLGAAAVIDRSFDFDTVWRASGRTELEVADALDESVRHRLVITASLPPSTEATYEFSHEKLRTFVYEALSPARRRVLHRRVAEALVAEARRPGRAAALSALIARHLEKGGVEDEAAGYHEQAAIYARSISANRAALDHYLAALALGHPSASVLHEGAGDMLVLLGEYREAIGSYEAAAARAESDAIPRLEHRLGEVHLRRGDWELAQSHLVVALETLGEDAGEHLGAKILAALSFNAYRKGALDEAADLGLRALQAATASGDAQALAHARNQMGILENARGRHEEATRYLEESLALAAELDDAGTRAAALNNLAQSARLKGDVGGALELTREALEICTQQGDSHREAALHNNLADLLHQKGDSEAAMQQLKMATAVLAKIGDEPTGMLPEVWKLVEW